MAEERWMERFRAARSAHAALAKLPGTSKERGDLLEVAVRNYEAVVHDEQEYLSSNEDLEGVNTSNLAYIFANFYLFEVLQLFSGPLRYKALVSADAAIIRFFSICVRLDDRLMSQQEFESAKACKFPTRDEKIALFRAQKELSTSISNATDGRRPKGWENEEEDEKQREVCILRLRLCVLEGINGLLAIRRELPMLKQFMEDKEDGRTNPSEDARIPEAQRPSPSGRTPQFLTITPDTINAVVAAQQQQLKLQQRQQQYAAAGESGPPLDTARLLQREGVFRPTVALPTFSPLAVDGGEHGPNGSSAETGREQMTRKQRKERESQEQSQREAVYKMGGKVHNWDDVPDAPEQGEGSDLELTAEEEEEERLEAIQWDEWTDSAARGDRKVTGFGEEPK